MSDLSVIPVDQLRLAFGIYTVIGTVVAVPQIRAIWMKRHHPIIRNRGFSSLMIILLGCYSTFLMLGIGGSFNRLCYLYPLALAQLLFMFCFAFERVIVVYILYLITLKSREYAKDNLGFDSLELEDAHFADDSWGHRVQEWLFRNRSKINTTDFFCKTKFYECIVAVTTGLAMFALFAFLGPQSLSQPFLSDECITTGQLTWKWIFVIAALIMVPLAWLPVQLRKVKENYFALKEFAAFAKFGTICVISIPIHAFYPKGAFPPRSLYPLWVMTIMQTATFIFSGYILLLIRRSRAENGNHSNTSYITALPPGAQGGGSFVSPNSPTGTNAHASSAKSSRDKLLFMLTNSDAFRALEQFLCKEFSVENGYFFNSVERFNTCCLEMKPEFDFRAAAKKIFDEYCSETASLCVNISFEQRQRIIHLFKEEKTLDDATFIQDSRRLLSDAQSEIFELILRDSFRRFVKSQEYADYKAKTGGDV